MPPSPGPLCFLTALATPHCSPAALQGRWRAPLGPVGIRNIVLSAWFSSPVGFTTAPLTRVLLEHRGRPGGYLGGGWRLGGGKQRERPISPHPVLAAGLALTFMGHTGGTHRHQKDHHDIAAGRGPPEPLAWLRPSSPAHSVMSSPRSLGGFGDLEKCSAFTDHAPISTTRWEPEGKVESAGSSRTAIHLDHSPSKGTGGRGAPTFNILL